MDFDVACSTVLFGMNAFICFSIMVPSRLVQIVSLVLFTDRTLSPILPTALSELKCWKCACPAWCSSRLFVVDPVNLIQDLIDDGADSSTSVLMDALPDVVQGLFTEGKSILGNESFLFYTQTAQGTPLALHSFSKRHCQLVSPTHPRLGLPIIPTSSVTRHSRPDSLNAKQQGSRACSCVVEVLVSVIIAQRWLVYPRGIAQWRL